MEASNNNYNNNDNNRSDVDDLSEETATTAGAADSSDQSDKFNRPPTHNQKKPKLSKLGTKSVGLKRCVKPTALQPSNKTPTQFIPYNYILCLSISVCFLCCAACRLALRKDPW